MNQEFFKLSDGLIVVKDNDSIRVKSTYIKRVLTEEEFSKSNPVKISKQNYLTELNNWFKNYKHEWEYQGVRFRKLDNFDWVNQGTRFRNADKFEMYDMKNLPKHNLDDLIFKDCFIVLYHGHIYYTFYSSNYFPQMQLIDFKTKHLTAKWTNIKNLAPIFNCETKEII